jgi:sigma-B regulation protein RsbU (phosphoserine phosphatase)
VTAFLAVLDPRTGRVEYCNAGHNPPYVVTRDGGATTLETGGLLLGMLEDSAYAQGVADLAPGATLVLFTDGVTEAQRADSAMWGEERLVASLARGGSESCAALVRRVVDEVRAFEGDQGPSDDITLLIARRVAG